MSDYQQGSGGPPPTPFGGPGGATAAPPGSPQAYNPPPQAPQQGYAQQYGQPGAGGQPGYAPQGYGQPGPGGQPGYGAAGFAQPGAKGKGDPIAWLTVVSAVLLFIGAGLPWASVLSIEVSGLDGGDGIITISLGVLLLALGVTRAFTRHRWTSIVGLILALLLGLVVLIDLTDVLGEDLATVRIGLWLTTAGAVGALLGTLITLRKT